MHRVVAPTATPARVRVGGCAHRFGGSRVTRGAETRSLHWDQGEIVFARSNTVRDSLGNFLVRKGIITPEQNAVSASKIDETTRHGKVLVRIDVENEGVTIRYGARPSTAAASGAWPLLLAALALAPYAWRVSSASGAEEEIVRVQRVV